MTLKTAICTTATALGAAFGFSFHLKRKYAAPSGSKFSYGDNYFHKGKTYKFVGYTGHHKDTFQKSMHHKPIYFGDKALAQRYAKANGGEEGAVGHVIAEKTPSHKDLVQNESPHTALSTEGQQNCGAQVVNPEPVTAQTDVRLTACWRRFKDDFRYW